MSQIGTIDVAGSKFREKFRYLLSSQSKLTLYEKLRLIEQSNPIISNEESKGKEKQISQNEDVSERTRNHLFMMSGNSYQKVEAPYSEKKRSVGLSAIFQQVPRDNETIGRAELTRV